MSKYAAVAKILFKAQLIYRFDVVLTALGTIWRVLFAWILWGAVFAGRDSVGGFSFQGMLSYYVVGAFLASIDMSDGVCGEVSRRVRGGTFSKFMVIPSDPQLHFIAQSLGAGAYYALFAVLAAAVCAVVFRINLTFSADPAAILCAVLMQLLGLVFMCSYQFFIGILTFKFQGIDFFTHVQGAALSFLTGAIVPLSLLPDAVTGVLRFIPFTYVAYTPAMLLTGQMSGGEGFMGLAALVVWTAVMLLTSTLTYRRLRIKYDGVGI